MRKAAKPVRDPARPAVASIADAKALVVAGRADPASAWPDIERLAASDAWETREVAATAVVEIGKRHPDAVLAIARRWARAADPNVRRAATMLWRGIGYDTAGSERIAQYLADPGGSVSSHRFSYDSLGQLSRDEIFTPSFPCQTDSIYGYKCSGTVTTTVDYRYDAGRNDTTSNLAASYGTGNRMLSRGVVSYGYDDDGHRTKVKKSASDSTLHYWSPDGVLEKVTSGTTTVEYGYDAKGQLVRRKTNGSVDRVFLWGNGHLLAELKVDGSTLTRIGEYAYYPGSDRPLALVTGATAIAKTRYFQQDALHNVTAIVGGSRSFDDNVYEATAYDAWGKVAQITTDIADTNRLRWKGLLWEGDSTQLYYVRARWYDPAARRFVSEDPSGLDAGINLYVFAGNDPINYVDPSGRGGDRTRGNENGEPEACPMNTYLGSCRRGGPDGGIADDVFGYVDAITAEAMAVEAEERQRQLYATANSDGTSGCRDFCPNTGMVTVTYMGDTYLGPAVQIAGGVLMETWSFSAINASGARITGTFRVNSLECFLAKLTPGPWTIPTSDVRVLGYHYPGQV